MQPAADRTPAPAALEGAERPLSQPALDSARLAYDNANAPHWIGPRDVRRIVGAYLAHVADPAPAAPAPGVEAMAEALWEVDRSSSADAISWAELLKIADHPGTMAVEVLKAHRARAAAILARFADTKNSSAAPIGTISNGAERKMAADPARATLAGAVRDGWRPMFEEPIGRPITARMKLGDGSWWYARVRVWRHEDGGGGRFGDHGYELLHYNGDVTMGRFYGPFDSWCEVDAALAAEPDAGDGWRACPTCFAPDACRSCQRCHWALAPRTGWER